MSSVRVRDQPVNIKSAMQEQFEYWLNKQEMTENSAKLTCEKLLSLIAEVKNAKIAHKKYQTIICYFMMFL